MSRYSTFSTIAILTLLACTLSAQEPTVAPEIVPPLLPAPPQGAAPLGIPEAIPAVPRTDELPYVPQPVPPMTVGEPLVLTSEPVVLYPHVRVKDPHKSHPYGVPTVVAVTDPRDRCGVVYVEVCMPPCECEKIRRNRRGNRVKYDFGKFEILIISRLGIVIVDYNT